jgi:octaprenyl-diphosphate synthase
MKTLSATGLKGSGLRAEELRLVIRPVAEDMRAVEDCLTETFADVKDPAVSGLVDFVFASPGKRIRPALALLSARAVSPEAGCAPRVREAAIRLGAAVELIHVASLVHDDFVDAAAIRRHQPSVNAKWGAEVSVALGDLLCAHALRLVARCEDPRICAQVGGALSTMCEGEMMQVLGRCRFDLSERDCLAAIKKKTAAFFAACCSTAATLAGAENARRRHLEDFGLHVGMGFQILDDCRDLLGTRGILGKTPAQDVLSRDVTLPLLHVLKENQGRKRLLRLDRDGLDAASLDRIRESFHSSGGSARIEQLGRSYTDRAKRDLRSIADSDFKNSLCRLADWIAESISQVLSR